MGNEKQAGLIVMTMSLHFWDIGLVGRIVPPMKTPARLVIFLNCVVCYLALTSCTREGKVSRISIGGRDVTQVIVVEVPRTVSAPTAYTPETLEQRYHQKLDLRAGAFLGHINELNEAVSKTKCEQNAGKSDLRTGIIFFDPSGARVRSFYYGADSSIGAIDDTSCRLSPALYRWVRKQLKE